MNAASPITNIHYHIEQDTFWLLAATIDKHLAGYYTPGLERLRMHAGVFETLLHKHIPKLAAHLVGHSTARTVIRRYTSSHVLSFFLRPRNAMM